MYLQVWDTQCGRYFHDEDYKFKDLKEVCDHLIDYHSIDCDMEVEQKLFDQGDYLNCWKALEQFDWELTINK